MVTMTCLACLALDTWAARPLAEVDVVYVYLDAIALRIRCAGRVGSTPVLAAVGVLADGTKQLLALELCGGESADAWLSSATSPASEGRLVPSLRRFESGRNLPDRG